MNRFSKILGLLFVAFLATTFVSCDDDDDSTTKLSNLGKAKALLMSFQKGDVMPSQMYVNQEKYIQHNLGFPDGIGAVTGYIQSGGSQGVTVNTVRAFEDSDYVILHTVYGGTWHGGVPQVAFDVFRFENGLIVEHWDNLQNQSNPTTDAVNGHTQIDGETTIGTEDATANKTLVQNMVKNVLIAGKWSEGSKYFSEGYIQHSIGMPNGIAWMANMHEGVGFFSSMKYIYGSGNFVITLSEGPEFKNNAPTGNTIAYYDLFRIEDGKIIEHWDTYGVIPDKSTWANTNGKW